MNVRSLNYSSIFLFLEFSAIIPDRDFWSDFRFSLTFRSFIWIMRFKRLECHLETLFPFNPLTQVFATCWHQILARSRTYLSWLNRKRVSRRNSRRLNRLIPINERKVILKRKTDWKSRSGIIAENPRKRKTDEQANDRTFAVCKKNENRSLKRTNEQAFAK